MKRLILALALSLSFGCALHPSAPPNLTPQVTAKFYATYAIKDLDVIRDFANDAARTTPPIISKATLLVIVNWHEATVKVIHAAPDGWKAAAAAGLDELKTLLAPADYAKFKAAIDAAKAYISEVQ
jgi:hypothetical protein